MPPLKKSAPSFPTADQFEQLRTRLSTLVSVGDPKKVDGQVEQLLLSLGLDPTSPTAWRDGFYLLACLHYDIGKSPRTNRNAQKLLSDDNLVLIRETIQLMGRGLTEGQAIKELAGDRRKEHLFKFKPLSSTRQREQTLQKRLDKIKEASREDTWLLNVIGKAPDSIVEEVLLNLVMCEAMKAKEKRNRKLDRS